MRDIYLYNDETIRIRLDRMIVRDQSLTVILQREAVTEEERRNWFDRKAEPGAKTGDAATSNIYDYIIAASGIKVNGQIYSERDYERFEQWNNEDRLTFDLRLVEPHGSGFEALYLFELRLVLLDLGEVRGSSKLIEFQGNIESHQWGNITMDHVYTDYKTHDSAPDDEDALNSVSAAQGGNYFSAAGFNVGASVGGPGKSSPAGGRNAEGSKPGGTRSHPSGGAGVNPYAARTMFTGAGSEDGGEHLNELMALLDSLPGLESVKNEIHSMVNLVRIQEMRKNRGMKSIPMSLHMVFTGNPGTGKTTVARLLAQIYKEIGILSRGIFVETDRSGLVSRYIGGTAIKVRQVVDTALGGILFIDEAYALNDGQDGNDYGKEAIATLLKQMEDHRDDLIVIVAGYPDKMRNFLQSNPGLMSRFNKFIYFDDYSAAELTEIFQWMCEENGYSADEAVLEAIHMHYLRESNDRRPNFANGRDVRNLFERAVTNQANRLVEYESVSDEELLSFLPEDVMKEA